MKFINRFPAGLFFTATAVILAANPAFGQVKKQLAIVPLKAASESTQLLEACNNAVREEVGKIDTLILLDPAEIAARLDLEGKNTPGCLGDHECLISNGEVLGIDGVLYGTVTRESDAIAINLKLYLVKEKKEDRTFSARMVGEISEAAALTAKAAAALVTGQPLPEVTAPPPVASQPVHEPAGGLAAPSKKPAGTVQSKQPEEKKRIWSWVCLSAEIATLTSAITLNVLSVQTNDEIHKGGKTRKDLDSMISTGRNEMIAAYVMYGLAAAAAGATIYFFWYESDRSETQTSSTVKSLYPTAGYDPLSNGAYLGLGGRF